MESSEFTMTLPVFLSGRVVNRIVQETNTLKSAVCLIKNNRTVNMKSILGILSSDCRAGDEVNIICLHNDKDVAEQDCRFMERLLKSGDLY